jgi:hypothetical protein
MIDPLVVGGGKRLFGDGIPIRALRLVESQVTGTGGSSRPTLRPNKEQEKDN